MSTTNSSPYLPPVFYAKGGYHLKVLIATDTYRPAINGIVTSVINLKAGLEARGHEVRILTLSRSKRSYYEHGIYYIGSLDMSLFYPDIRLKVKKSSKEVAHIAKWRPDIIHTQNEFFTFYVAMKVAKKLSIPVTHTYHTMYEDYTHYFAPSRTVGKIVVEQITHHVDKQVNGFIAPTEKIGKVLTSYGISTPVNVVPSGISLSKFEGTLSQEETTAMRQSLDIPQDHKVILSVSRIGKEKNIDELIYFMSHLQEENIILVIAGDGPHLNELKQLAASLKLSQVVRFTGMIAPEKIPAIYQMADLFVSASTSETQGLTYIEALASGTPILCRKDDCLQGVLVEGYNGYSFNHQDEFLEKLRQFFAHDDRALFSVHAREVAQNYSVPMFARRVERLYLHYLENKKFPVSIRLTRIHRRPTATI